MKQFPIALAAALFAAIASMSFSLQANAASYPDYSTLKSSAQSSSPLLQQAYYERRSNYDEEEDYEDKDYYEEEDEDDYRPRKHHKRRHYEPRKSCHTEYVSKYVCKQPVPRCLKQRECVWHYGEEYCRYVRKCTRTENKCHYVKVPRRKCW
jgi:hypothetical protein